MIGSLSSAHAMPVMRHSASSWQVEYAALENERQEKSRGYLAN
jgi:hypothetical protein